MKRLLLAGLLVMTMALSRAAALAGQDDAYGSLIGMADSAARDKGPEAGDMPADLGNRDGGHPGADAPKPVIETGSAERREVKPVAQAPAPKREAVKDDGAPSVAVPAAPAPRVWTRLFSSLLPPAARVSGFDVAVSSAARRGRPAPAHPATAASAAGSAQGMLELVAAATAPTTPTAP
ncbi:MAG: hypothetical protein ABL955_08920 [Elusimicrobiota bacterium]